MITLKAADKNKLFTLIPSIDYIMKNRIKTRKKIQVKSIEQILIS